MPFVSKVRFDWCVVILLYWSQICCADKCSVCESGTYCFSDQKYVCPQHSTSKRSSDNITACVCLDGFRPSNDHLCVECEAGSYCVNEIVRLCPADSTSDAGAASVNDCRCLQGFSGPPTDCVACEAGKYNSLNVCIDCPPHSFSEKRSPSLISCICNAGYHGLDGGDCTSCDTGQYKSLNGSSSCVSCPTNSLALEASVSIEACRCRVGFYASDSGCVFCLPGTVKNIVSDDPCVACEPGKYSNPDRSVCLECVAGKFSSGFGSSECQVCAAGSVSLSRGNSSCTLCVANSKTSGENIATNRNSWDDCRCEAGFEGLVTGSNEDCVACAIGKYKSETSTVQAANCQSCSIGSTTSSTATILATECLTCEAERYGVIVDDAGVCAQCSENKVVSRLTVSTGICVCAFGFTGPDCVACNAGTFKDVIGDLECTTCPHGYVSSSGQNQCTECTRGHVEINNICEPCDKGTYEIGHICIDCESDKYSDVVAASTRDTCTSCWNHSTSLAASKSLGDCLCLAGYTGATCEKCPEGSWKQVTGPESCNECASDTHWPSSIKEHDKNACRSCPANSFSNASTHGIDNCMCFPGYVRVLDECDLCAAGSYCAGGLLPSIYCPPDSNSSVGSVGLADCNCNPGHHGEYGNCTLCAVNMFCVGGAFSQNCPSHATTLTATGRTSIVDCICEDSYYEFNNTCVVCPMDSYCYGDNRVRCGPNSTAVRGSNSKSDCFCDTDFVEEGPSCVACGASRICGGVLISTNMLLLDYFVQQQVGSRRLLEQFPEWFDESGFLAAVAESLNEPVSSLKFDHVGPWEEEEGSKLQIRIVAFMTDVEAARSFSSSTPEEIEMQYMKIELQSAGSVSVESMQDLNYLLISHPSISYFISAKKSKTCAADAVRTNGKCTCLPGTFCASSDLTLGCLEESECLACREGSFCHNNKEFSCPQSETSLARSDNATDCYCISGYHRREGRCEICPLNSYCIDEIQYLCTDFDENLVTHAPGRTSLTECKCAKGLFRLDREDKCASCPKDFFCPVEFAVLPCMQFGFTEERGSSSSTACKCHGGFMWDPTNEDQCLECKNDVCGGGAVVEFCHESREPDDTHTACVCRAGSEPMNIAECMPCSPGYVKSVKSNNKCEACPLNTVSDSTELCVACPVHQGTTSHASTLCICDSPYVSVTGICAECPNDFYFKEDNDIITPDRGNCVFCGTNATSPLGSNSPDDCKCDPGYYRVGTGHEFSCVACDANFFEKNGTCELCGVDAVSPKASSSESDCICPFLNCSYGKQRPPKLFGRHCLLKCDPVRDTCVACDAGKIKPSASLAGNGDQCFDCLHGQFQEHSGQTVCQECTSTRYHTIPGATDSHSCLCIEGYYPDPLPTKTGFYKPLEETFFLTVHKGQTVQIGWHSAHPFGVSAESVGGALLSSSVFGYDAGNADQVTRFHVPTDFDGVLYFFCMRHGQMGPNSQIVITERSKGNDACLPCAVGHYKETRSSDDLCLPCPAGEFMNATGASACFSCADHASMNGADYTTYAGSISVLSCTCNAGAELLGNTCTACETGSFKTDTGDHACVLCGGPERLNEYGDVSVGVHLHAHCQNCPFNSGQNSSAVTRDNRMNHIDDCYCFPHFELANSNCRACDQYQVKEGYNNNECVLCESGEFVNDAHKICVACYLPTHSANPLTTREHKLLAVNSVNESLFWGIGKEDCACEIGYERLLDECHACQKGFYRGKRLPQECLPCATNTFMDSPGALECQLCPGNSYTNGTAKTNINDCLCPLGYAWTGSECVSCSPGSIRPDYDYHSPCVDCVSGFYLETRAGTACDPCGVNEFSVAPFSSLQTHCRCERGFGLLAGICTACEIGFYSNGGTELSPRPTCQKCPLHKSTIQNRTVDISDCLCIAGYGIPTSSSPDTDCVGCLSGYYSEGGYNMPCLHCGFGSVSDLNSDKFSDCQCDATVGLYSN